MCIKPLRLAAMLHCACHLQYITRNVFKKDKRRQIKKGRKYNTRLSTCT